MRYWLTKLYNFSQLARANLLYVPVLISIGFVLVGIGVFQLDLHYKDFFSDKRFIYNGDVEEAGDVLGLLLTCMITMTTLVISITMVVLSLSASQLGPRLVRIFMGDRRTKIFIGIFFGSIALCFTCIGILHDPIATQSTPRLLTSVTFLVCFLNLFILLAYVNHVARSGVADNIIARLTRELLESIDRLAPDRSTAESAKPSPDDFPAITTHQKKILRSPVSGYIQSIEYHCLLDLANKKDAFIRLNCKAGEHVVEGQEIGEIYEINKTSEKSSELPSKQLSGQPSQHPSDPTPELLESSAELLSELHEAILIGEYRSATQDIEYSIRHMVEIALRALSPGVNDPFTAITVLDKLTGVLRHLFTRALPPYSYTGDDGTLRVLGVSSKEADLIFEALAEIRYAGQDQRLILECLIKNTMILMALANETSQHNALALQLEHVKIHINTHFANSPTGTFLTRLLNNNEATS